MNLVRIPTKELDKVWSLIEKDIRQALLYSGQLTNSDFVLQTAKQDKFQVWVLWDKKQKTTLDKYFGVVVTELIQRQLGKVCHVYIMTGRQRQKWQHLVKVVEDFAKENKCQMVELIARPGWQKVMNNFGFKRTHVVLEKQIKLEEKK
jgi:type II secretory pathway component PulJ|tara:strand:+ start:451 stop:894 length:444 start_codon:yes stop_codon:yes gene_type:complete